MKSQSHFTDEVLNAYIDDELSTQDALSLLEAMQQDAGLASRVNELRRLKLLVTTTYSIKNEEGKSAGNKNSVNMSLVASVVLILGAISGWLAHDYLLIDDSNPASLTKINAINKNKDVWNIVLHVNSNDKYVQKTILDETENLLESFKSSRKKVRVEIVAYGKGVFLFDSEKSKYKERLAALKNNFSNLSYAVCGRTIKRLEKVEGRKIQLISNLTVARSGLYQIIKRQKQGWNYIRI